MIDQLVLVEGANETESEGGGEGCDAGDEGCGNEGVVAHAELDGGEDAELILGQVTQHGSVEFHVGS